MNALVVLLSVFVTLELVFCAAIVYALHRLFRLFATYSPASYQQQTQAMRTEKPVRTGDERSISNVSSKKGKFSLKNGGITKTQDELVDLTQVDPETLMKAFDDHGRLK